MRWIIYTNEWNIPTHLTGLYVLPRTGERGRARDSGRDSEGDEVKSDDGRMEKN